MYEYDEPYDEDDEANSNVFVDGVFRVLAERCPTCIFRPGNPMHLQPGRVKEMVEGSLAGGAYITCHQTLPYGAYPETAPAVCRGFYDAHGDRSQAIQIATRLDLLDDTIALPAKEGS
jgi:hypothetical protein